MGITMLDYANTPPMKMAKALGATAVVVLQWVGSLMRAWHLALVFLAVCAHAEICTNAVDGTVTLQGPGTFDLNQDNSSLTVSLVATNGAQVAVSHEWALGAASRPFTLYCGTTGNATANRYLSFAADMVCRTPILICDATGDLMPPGSSLAFVEEFGGVRSGTAAVGVNTGSTLLFSGGVNGGALDRLFINMRSGGTTIITNRPLLAYTGVKNNEFDLNSYGTVQQTPVFRLDVAGNAWNVFRVFCSRVVCGVENALAPGGWLRFGRSDWTPQTLPERMELDLDGHDQLLGGLSTDWHVATVTGKTYNVARYARVTSKTPATLTLTPVKRHTGENGIVYAAIKFSGAVGLRFAPGSVSPALTLVHQVSDTKGDLEVTGGTLTFAKGAGWAGATNVIVKGSGVLAIDDADSAAKVFGGKGSLTALHLRDQGRLAIPAGCTVTVHNVVFDGVRAYAGTYGGAGSGAADVSHAAHFVAGGGVLKSVLSGEQIANGPETSSLFEEHTDAVSGVKSYVLRPGLVDYNHQSYYFTTKSMTDDGRFLLFKACTNEFWFGKSPARRNLFIDFKTDSIVELKDASFSSSWVDVERDQVWYLDRYGLHRRDLLEDPQIDHVVCVVPPELAYVAGQSYSYGTHITFSPDRTRVFLDARTGDIFRQGMINVVTGEWEEWGQERFCCNHGQLNPIDGNLGMCAWEYGSYLVTDELPPERLAGLELQSPPYTTWEKRPSDYLYPRIWLFRPDCMPWMVRGKITNYATHEIFSPDGKGILWCSSGVCHLDLVTGRESRISPVGAAHATMTADGKCLVFDASVNGWWRGCDWTVRFWNREAHRSCYIHNFMKRMAEQSNESKLHPDPHPQFVCNDRYVVCTALMGPETGPVNNRYMALSVTPVQQLIDLTEAMAVSNAAKRLEVLGWRPGIAGGTPCELTVDTATVEQRLRAQGQQLLVSQCTQNGREFTSYAIEAVVNGVTSAVPFEAIQHATDYRQGAVLRVTPPRNAEKLLLVVDPPGRYEVQDSELCANLFDRRDIRDYYPPVAVPGVAAVCAVTNGAGGPVKLELDVRNFSFASHWLGSIRLQQYDGAGHLLGEVLDRSLENIELPAGCCGRWRVTGRLAAAAAEVRLVFAGETSDGAAPKLQLQHLNLRPAFVVDPHVKVSDAEPVSRMALVVDVPAGTTNAFDFTSLGRMLTSNVATNFIKRGGGTLVVSSDLSSYLGDITVEAGTYRYTRPQALGRLAGEMVCGCVRVLPGGALDAYPASTASGNDWGSFNKRIYFAGAGPDGQGALKHTGGGMLSRMYFGTNLVMTADARIGNLTRQTLYQNGLNGPIYLMMRGHTLTLGGSGPFALGGWCVRWPGRIVAADGVSVTVMNAGTSFDGTELNDFSFGSGGWLNLNKPRGTLAWTMDATHMDGLQVLDGVATGVDTNTTCWSGPVKTGGCRLSVKLGSCDLALSGPISGAGFDVVGTSGSPGRLHLMSPENSFSNGLGTAEVEVFLWRPDVLPATGGSLAMTNGAVHLMAEGAYYNLPPLQVEGDGKVLGDADGTWRNHVRKTGRGCLSWSNLTGSDLLDVRGGRVALMSRSRRSVVAGLIESRRHDYADVAAEISAMWKEMHQALTVETNIVTLSTAAFYDRRHHLWTDPKPIANATYRCLFSYSGYVWNNSPTNEVWSFAGAAGTHLSVFVGGSNVLYWSNTPDIGVGTATLVPGPNRIDVRTYTTGAGAAAAARGSWTIPDFMVGYDPQGRGLTDQTAYLKLVDPGDGSLLTWCLPEELEDGVTQAPGGSRPLLSQPRFPCMRFAAGTGVDFASSDYALMRLEGVPAFTGATAGITVDKWVVPMADVVAGNHLSLAGPLRLRDIYLDDATHATHGRGRYVIAISSGGITLTDAATVDGCGAIWRLELSPDRRTLYARRIPRQSLLMLH
ncbi:MAG: hypothetical protein MJ240_02430 [Kiritimatiellae bacterium]|nr:hypothetical protein [Kiritimatiellia bacterium]